MASTGTSLRVPSDKVTPAASPSSQKTPQLKPLKPVTKLSPRPKLVKRPTPEKVELDGGAGRVDSEGSELEMSKDGTGSLPLPEYVACFVGREWFDKYFPMSQLQVSTTEFYQKKLRDRGSCKTIAAAIVGSRLDYCNSLLAGTSVSNLAHLQLVQNTLAWVVTEKSRFCHITPVLSELHWLPVCQRINFKIATITFKVLQFQQPSYLAALIPRYVPTRSLRSSSSLSLCIPTRKTEMAKSKSFSSVASSVWNKLPGHLSSISSLPAFRKKLKHHLFRSAFPGNPSPSTGITFFDVSPSTDATHVGHTPLPG